MPIPGAPRSIHNYNFGAVICTADTVTLSNFGADGGIALEAQSQIVESEISADGVVTYTYTSDERVRITLTLAQSSGSIPLLDALIRVQLVAMAEGAAVIPILLGVFDPASGDRLVEAPAVCMAEPQPSFSKGLSTREYIFEAPYARWRKVMGVRNAPTFTAIG